MSVRVIYANAQTLPLADGSVTAVVTDPPYGLEFMGREWDRLDAGLPQEAVWKGRRGKGGSEVHDAHERPGGARVAYGAKPHGFRRCTSCGRREFSGTPCTCEAPAWQLEYAQVAPSAAIRMQRWHELWAREAYRVLAPGGWLLAFSSTRTSHRLACAVEDAGFELRDTIAWLFGQGFPKNLDAGAAVADDTRALADAFGLDGYAARMLRGPNASLAVDAWQGWGTALKPGHEPIVVARKPLAGTVAANLLTHGTGALHIDGGRVSTGESTKRTRTPDDLGRMNDDGWTPIPGVNGSDAGRWPPNVILTHAPGCKPVGKVRKVRGTSGPTERTRTAKLDRDGVTYGGTLNEMRSPGYAGADGREQVPAWQCELGCPVAMVDQQTGALSRSTDRTIAKKSRGGLLNSTGEIRASDGTGYGDQGGGSRFYPQTAWDAELDGPGFAYVAKANTTERDAGTGGNLHPTVKPVAVMRWLLGLVDTGGLILDLFSGSGTTAVAAVLDGRELLALDNNAQPGSIETTVARVAYAADLVAAGRTWPPIIRAADPDALRLF